MNRVIGSPWVVAMCATLAFRVASPGFAIQRPPAAESVVKHLAGAKAQIMKADYEADLGTLAAAQAEVEQLVEDPGLGAVAHYWAGFAGWRYAMNAVNRQTETERVESLLRGALDHFDAAVRRDPSFIDAHAAAVGVAGWLLSIDGVGQAEQQELAAKVWRHLAIATQAEPTNPRVLWAEAGVYLNTPPEFGGDRARALTALESAVESAVEKPVSTDAADSILPDWGVPECLMVLAWAHLNDETPDPAAARDYAERSLALQPNWFYVRKILLPQIAAAEPDSAATRSDTAR